MITKEEAEKAYQQLVVERQKNPPIKTKPGEVEVHHILPSSCGGLDVPENKVALYAKEHFMAHVYLWIIHHDDQFHYQTMNALYMSIKGTLSGSRKELRNFILAAKEYQKAREEYAVKHSFDMKTNKNPMFGKAWYYDPITLKFHPFIIGSEPVGWKRGKKPKNEKPIILSEFDRLNIQMAFDCCAGNKANNRQVRRYLEKKYGCQCFKCNRSDLKIYIHNIDGNMKNLNLSNYEFLCKECYFKSGNIGWQLKKY